MAIILKSKTPRPAASPEVLAALGLAPQTDPKPTHKLGGIVLKGGPVQYFKVGDRVAIANTLFPWLDSYQPGDEGTIEHLTGVPPVSLGKPSDFLYRVRLDNPRTKPVVILAHWELKKAA